MRSLHSNFRQKTALPLPPHKKPTCPKLHRDKWQEGVTKWKQRCENACNPNARSSGPPEPVRTSANQPWITEFPDVGDNEFDNSQNGQWSTKTAPQWRLAREAKARARRRIHRYSQH